MSDQQNQQPDANARDEGLVQYLVSEFVQDYQDGHMSRRDALKRIAGILGSMVLAENLLAACAPAAAPAPAATATAQATAAPTSAPIVSTLPVPSTATAVPPTTAPTATSAPQATATTALGAATRTATGVTIQPDDPAIQASPVQFPGQGATILAYLARPKGDGPFPAVLVCHENRGLLEHIKDVARRAAKAGYAALAVDLLSRQGGTDKIGDAAQVPGLLANAPAQQAVQDFRDGMLYLQGLAYVAKDRTGMVGFCFGGGITWRSATQIPELEAAVPFYGPNPPLEDVPKIKAAVLAIYGELDTRITSGAAAIEEAMKKNGKTFEKIVYPQANHAFHNDTGANYNAEAARDAWAKTLAWFDKYLKA